MLMNIMQLPRVKRDVNQEGAKLLFGALTNRVESSPPPYVSGGYDATSPHRGFATNIYEMVL